ncbi:MAG: 16S rRNA (guanine(966)-N(2))-methyltransferase RsmD [Chlamydiales bacterium]|nr:16S rRNA (guanine(966)-N(2))-methyltransferase RsmD [Chlamydiales bacterium]
MLYIIAGKYKKRKLMTPKGGTTRPSLGKMRETLFNICQNEIEGASFLDLFAGAGAIGLEALSRGAHSLTLVEKDRNAQHCIEKNIEALGVHAHLIKGDVFKALEHLPPFDIIYADPPYGKGFSARVATLVEQYQLLKEGGSLFLEDSTKELPELKQLQKKSSRKTGRSYLHHLVAMAYS